jgi:hypothetical protein
MTTTARPRRSCAHSTSGGPARLAQRSRAGARSAMPLELRAARRRQALAVLDLVTRQNEDVGAWAAEVVAAVTTAERRAAPRGLANPNRSRAPRDRRVCDPCDRRDHGHVERPSTSGQSVAASDSCHRSQCAVSGAEDIAGTICATSRTRARHSAMYSTQSRHLHLEVSQDICTQRELLDVDFLLHRMWDATQELRVWPSRSNGEGVVDFAGKVTHFRALSAPNTFSNAPGERSTPASSETAHRHGAQRTAFCASSSAAW